MAKAELIRPIVPIEEWLTSEFYLGDEVEAIRPYVAEFVKEFSRATYVNEMGIRVPKRKFIATGASRTGKSYGSRILLDRVFYEMSCWRNFPCLFGLSPSTMPKVFWLSYTLGKSSSTGMKGLMKIIDKTPYWQLPDVKRKDVESAIIFPFCEVLPGSNVSHIIGEDMLGCVLDEANVRKVAQGTEVEETQKMFQEMRQRSVMTFSKNGIWGGFSGIISSTTTSSSFVALELEKAKKDGDTVIMEASVYEANPEQYSKEKFPIFIGDGEIEPFIVDQADAAITGQINETYGLTVKDFLAQNQNLVEMVPVSIRKFYEEDLSFSLANMSGKVQTGEAKWLRKKLTDGMWSGDEKPFSPELVDIGIYDDPDWESLLSESYVMAAYHGERVYVHVDFGQKHDHTGFSALYYDQEAHKVASLLTMEMKVNGDISDNVTDQTKVWELILLLHRWGADIRLVTGDIWAKSYLIPQAKLQDWTDGEYYSCDTDEMAAYLTMRNYMKVGLYSVPYYGRLEEELLELVKNNGTGKIDHMPNSDPANPRHFKDLVDAFATASFHIYTRENISYEELIMQKGREAVHDRIPSDGFYESIGREEVADDVDAELEFQKGLYGEESDYQAMESFL